MRSLFVRMLLPLLMLAAVAPHAAVKVGGGGGGTKCVDECPCVWVGPDFGCLPFLLTS